MATLTNAIEWLDYHKAQTLNQSGSCKKVAPQHYRVVKILSKSKGALVIAEENDDCTAEGGFAYQDESAVSELDMILKILTAIANQAF